MKHKINNGIVANPGIDSEALLEALAGMAVSRCVRHTAIGAALGGEKQAPSMPTHDAACSTISDATRVLPE